MPGPGRPFKPGQSGNPGGQKKADPELLALKALTAQEFKEVANLALMDDIAQVKAIEADQTQPLFRRWLARLAIRGFERGDRDSLEFFANRLLGKVPEKLEATSAHVVTQVPADELKVRLEQLRSPKAESNG
mgnify:CR=1 FL=1